MIVRETDAMIVLPPIEPATITSSPCLSVIIDGDMDERGALRGATAFATGLQYACRFKLALLTEQQQAEAALQGDQGFRLVGAEVAVRRDVGVRL